jgi:hypothetical protein
MYGLQPFNQNLVYNLYIAYQPTVYKGEHGVLGRALGGWSFAPIFTAGTGQPIECNTLNGDSQSYGEGDSIAFFSNENCMFNSGIPAARAHDTFHPATATSPAFNTMNIFGNPVGVAATARPAILGIDNKNGGAGVMSGLNYWNLDFQVRKAINITERYNLEFQVMLINVLNHVDYTNPSGDILDLGYGLTPSFGDVSTQANTPRQFEFGARFNF